MLKGVPPVLTVDIQDVVKMKENEDGVFVNGAFTPNDFGEPDNRRQTIEIKHSMSPYKASIKLNGKELRCRRYEIHQEAREFGTIVIEFALTDYEVKSDSGILYVELDGMRFKRVE